MAEPTADHEFCPNCGRADGFVWCDPPGWKEPDKGPDYVALAAPCKERPGEWARIHLFPGPNQAHDRVTFVRGRLELHTDRRAGRWEVKGVKLVEGSGLWVRYIPAS